MDQYHLEKIRHKKHFFVKSFLVSLIIMVICCLFGVLCFDFLADMAQNMFGVDYEDYAKIYMTASSIWKVLIIQFTLVPAIVLCMVEKHVKEKTDNNMN